jgi:crotonobetainyl-CoA:carnitine CoA-transferase CaiB-like acyl-CoA transferase
VLGDRLALEGLVVLEVSMGVAGAYCGRLLAMHGATVTLVEPTGGSALRGMGPFGNGANPGATGVVFLTLAAGKQSRALDLETPAGLATFESLCAVADVLVTDDLASLRRATIDPLELGTRFPRLVVAAVSPCGATGPYAHFVATSATVYALGGYTYLTGELAREPLQGPDQQPEYIAGTYACIGVLAALQARERAGRGQFVDVSEMECLASGHQWTLARFAYNGRVQERNGNRYDSFHPITYYDCADGVAALSPSSLDQLERLMLLIGREELLADPRFSTNLLRVTNADEFDREVQGWFRERPRDEVVRLCQEFRVPCAPALEVDELLVHEQLIARNFWRKSEHPVAGVVRLPGPPFRLASGTAPVGNAPLLGEHTKAPSPRASAFAAATEPGSSAPPLEGIRILDLTRVWSGPLGTRVLGDLGAEIIKIEHPAARGPARVPSDDPIRNSYYPDNDPGDEPWNRNAAFNKLNRNKQSLTLDLSHESAVGAFRGLVQLSDVVIDNYSPRVMGNLGLSFEELSGLNPRLVMVSMPGYGLDGPLRDGVAYGTTLDAEAGSASLMGYPGRGPQRLGVALPDPVAGLHAAVAVLMALRERRGTGVGQHVDLSQLESMVSLVGDQVVGFQLTGERPQRPGNRHAGMAPHGVYPCRAPGTWLSIAVRSDDEWARFAELAGDAALAADPRFATLAGRLKHQDALDETVAEWTRNQVAHDAMLSLQARGIPAAHVLSAADLFHDSHLRAREFFVTLTHPNAGAHDYAGLPIHLSRTPPVFRGDAPRLGEHNRAILGGLLGMDARAIDAMEAEGAIASRPPG